MRAEPVGIPSQRRDEDVVGLMHEQELRRQGRDDLPVDHERLDVAAEEGVRDVGGDIGDVRPALHGDPFTRVQPSESEVPRLWSPARTRRPRRTT